MSENEWHENLPEDLRNAPIFKPAEDGTIKSVEQVIIDLTNLTQVAGNSLRMPGPDAGDDDIAAFQARVMEKVPGLMVLPNMEDEENVAAHFTKFGKPKAAEDYKVPEIEGFELANVGDVKALAHANNMTQAQFTREITNQATALANASEKLATQHTEQTDIIKSEWGSAYDQNHIVVGKLLKENTLAPPELVEAFDKGELPAGMMRYLLNLSELGAEGTTFSKQSDGTDTVPVPEEAMEQLNEVENRLFAKDMRPGKPEYDLLVARRNKLMRLAYPEASLDADSMRA